MKYLSVALATAVAVGVTFGSLRTAHGELVFEDDLNAPAAATVEATVPVRVEVPKDLSKAEMMRRQRLREELKNEDLLTQKLEELRLKDEMKRTDELLGSGVSKTEVQSSGLEEQRVGSAALEVTPPVVATAAPVQGNALLAQTSAPATGMVVAAAVAPATTATVATGEDEEADMSRVSIVPRGGTASITNSIYDISAKYAAGVGIVVDLTDNFAFSGSYTYASYNLGRGGSLSVPMGWNQGFQQLTLNDNEFDIGARGYFLKMKSRARPYVGAGVGYRKGYINFDERTQQFRRAYDPYGARDVNITGFNGYLETGVDFRITKNISLTAGFRYFNILSSRQSNPISPTSFVDPYTGQVGYGGGYYAGALGSPYSGIGYDQRMDAGNALAKNNFYQLMAGISVSF